MSLERAKEIHAKLNAFMLGNAALPKDDRTKENDAKFLAVLALYRFVEKGWKISVSSLKLLKEEGFIGADGSMDEITRLVVLTQYEDYSHDNPDCLAYLTEFDVETFEAQYQKAFGAEPEGPAAEQPT